MRRQAQVLRGRLASSEGALERQEQELQDETAAMRRTNRTLRDLQSQSEYLRGTLRNATAGLGELQGRVADLSSRLRALGVADSNARADIGEMQSLRRSLTRAHTGLAPLRESFAKETEKHRTLSSLLADTTGSLKNVRLQLANITRWTKDLDIDSRRLKEENQRMLADGTAHAHEATEIIVASQNLGMQLVGFFKPLRELVETAKTLPFT